MDLRLALLLCFLPLASSLGPLAGSCKVQVSDCDCRVYHVHCQQGDGDKPYCANAHNDCDTQYDGLAILDSEVKHNAVHHFITANGWDIKANGCINKFGFWIGLTDHIVEGHFVWGPKGDSDLDGLCPSELTFSKWANGEPNNNTKKDNTGQDCVQMWFRGKHDGNWDDEYRNYRPKGAVCEDRIPHCDYAEYGFPDYASIPDC